MRELYIIYSKKLNEKLKRVRQFTLTVNLNNKNNTNKNKEKNCHISKHTPIYTNDKVNLFYLCMFFPKYPRLIIIFQSCTDRFMQSLRYI